MIVEVKANLLTSFKSSIGLRDFVGLSVVHYDTQSAQETVVFTINKQRMLSSVGKGRTISLSILKIITKVIRTFT